MSAIPTMSVTSPVSTTSALSLNRFLFKIIFFCANLLLAVTPFIFTWFNTELFEFNKMIFVYSMTLLTTSAWIGRVLVSKKIIFKRSFLDLPWLIFLTAYSLATVFSLHPYTSVFGYYSRFHGGLLSMICYALLYWGFVSNFNQKQIQTLLKTAVLACVGISLYAIPERLGASPSCLFINRKFDTNCWVQDVQNRVFASFGQPNWLGAYLGMILPLAISFHLNTIRQKKHLASSFALTLIKYRWFMASVLIFLALLFTQSRSALLGFAASLLLMLGYYFVVKHKSGRKELSLVSIVLVLMTLIIGTEFTPSLSSITNGMNQNAVEVRESTEVSSSLKQDQELPPGIFITPSEEIRLIVWRGALQVWQRYPWLGSGPETFGYSYYLDRPPEHNLVSEWDFLYNKAHNEWLNLLATTGALGLAAYLFLMGSTFWLTGKILWTGYRLSLKTTQPAISAQTQPSPEQLNLILGVAAGLIGFNITNLLGFSTVMLSVLWVLFMVFLSVEVRALTNQNRQKKQAVVSTNENGPPPKLSLMQIITLVWLGLITFHLSLKIVAMWQADHLHYKGKQLFAAQHRQAGLDNLQRAVLLSPNEALFYDELADSYAKIAVQFFENDEKEAAEQYAQLAQAATKQALELNPHHLNFYKSQSSIYSQLSVIDDEYLQPAKEALLAAQAKAPTDPKLAFQQGLLELAMVDRSSAIATIQKAIKMKPNYHQARYRLGVIFENGGECEPAVEQYRYILDNIIPGDQNLIERIEACGE